MKSLITALLVTTYCAFAQQPAAPVAPNASSLEITVTKPKTPSTLAKDEKVTVTIHYNNSGPNPVNIFARPNTNGKRAEGYTAHASSEYAKGSGDAEGWFTFEKPASVDEVVVTMVDTNTNETIVTTKLPVKMTWK